MSSIDRSEYEKSLAKMTDIFAKITTHATVQAASRCPYKNVADRCTAQFGCRNQRPASEGEDLLRCVSDDRFDYRSAWEDNAKEYEQMRETLRSPSSQDQNVTKIKVVCEGRDCEMQGGDTVFDAADALHVRVPTSCGRTGHCHECVVEIKRGMDAILPMTESEKFLHSNYRLACQAELKNSEVEVEFSLLRRTPKILTSLSEKRLDVDPVVTRVGENVCYDGEVVDSYQGHIYGLSVDLGTTTVVAELVDLETGQSVYLASFENPQRFAGSDVMHRISYDRGEFQGELHRAIVNTLNTEIRQMCAALGISRRELYEIFVVGNSTMRDLFFGLDVQSIGQKPYKSQVENEFLEGKRKTTALEYRARKLGIFANKNARAVGAPLVASHVGGDVVADLVAIDMASQQDVVMLVDAGTNTEVVIGHQGRLLAASCPAGPAFEGGLVSYGMPGCEGAIESVQYVDGKYEYQTIGDLPPTGICGSGLIGLLAELRRHNLMTPKGVFANKAKELTIVPEHGITFSRRDASELAQAKAANYCGQIILMRRFGVTPDQISKLYLAGGFANYVDPRSAVDIGFLAPVAEERVEKVGNAAAQGAKEMLLSRKKRHSIEQLVKTVEHVELETMPDFFEVFVEGCQVKPMVIPAG